MKRRRWNTIVDYAMAATVAAAAVSVADLLMLLKGSL
jgi:hypothetical protein